MLEVKIEELTKAVIALTKKIDHYLNELPVLEPVKAESTPVPVEIDPKIKVEAPAAPVMPDAPTFEPACPTHDVAKAPFTDGKGLIDYVMTAYKEMGAEKGAQIQNVLVEMGLQNVNELRPTEYDAFFAKVEALK